MNSVFRLDHVSKTYRIYSRPLDRLREMLVFGTRTYHEDLEALQKTSFEVGVGTASEVRLRAGYTIADPWQGTVSIARQGRAIPVTGDVVPVPAWLWTSI